MRLAIAFNLFLRLFRTIFFFRGRMGYAMQHSYKQKTVLFINDFGVGRERMC